MTESEAKARILADPVLERHATFYLQQQFRERELALFASTARFRECSFLFYEPGDFVAAHEWAVQRAAQ
jgi:hypothetical protein